MDKLDPTAWADGANEDELNERPGVQPLDAEMVEAYMIAETLLHEDVAPLFADWFIGTYLDDRNEDGEWTNGQLITDALRYWRGP